MPFQTWQNIKFTYLHQVACWKHQVACWIHQVACWIHQVACWIHQVALLNTSSCFVEYIKLLCWIHQVALLNTYAVPNATKYQVYILYLHQVVCWIHQVACVLHQVYQSKMIQVGVVVFIHQEGREPILIRSKFQLINKLEGGRVLKNLWQIFHGGWKK